MIDQQRVQEKINYPPQLELLSIVGACDSTLRVVRDWLIDTSLAPNVESSVDGGVTAVTALPTFAVIAIWFFANAPSVTVGSLPCKV